MARQTVNNGDSGLSARTKINDNFTELYSGTANFRGVSATLSADLLTINATGQYIVPWDGADQYDTGGWHDPASNNTRITPENDVNYVNVFFQIDFDSTLSTTQWVRLTIVRKNSGGTIVSEAENITATDGHAGAKGMSLTWLGEPVADGDYFEAHVTTESDTSISILKDYSRFRVMVAG